MRQGKKRCLVRTVKGGDRVIHFSKEKSHATHTGDKRFDYRDMELCSVWDKVKGNADQMDDVQISSELK